MGVLRQVLFIVLECSREAAMTVFVDVRLQGLQLAASDIQVQLSRRRPGQSNLTTPVRVRVSPSSSVVHRIGRETKRTSSTFSLVSNTDIRWGHPLLWSSRTKTNDPRIIQRQIYILDRVMPTIRTWKNMAEQSTRARDISVFLKHKPEEIHIKRVYFTGIYSDQLPEPRTGRKHLHWVITLLCEHHPNSPTLINRLPHTSQSSTRGTLFREYFGDTAPGSNHAHTHTDVFSDILSALSPGSSSAADWRFVSTLSRASISCETGFSSSAALGAAAAAGSPASASGLADLTVGLLRE